MSSAATVHRHVFPAMGSSVELVLVGGSLPEALTAFALAEVVAEEWERTFSRFRPESELSRLNRAAGAPVAVPPLLFQAIALAMAANAWTGGLFDPTTLDALVALGYDRTFSEVAPVSDRAPGVASVPGMVGIELDPERGTVCLPAGVRLDLGGVAKGLYADEVARRLAAWPGGVVSAAGDLAAWGRPPDGNRWRVGVENPADPERDVAALAVCAGGVATSGTSRRSWRRGAHRVHHLIDPRTGRPAASGLATVSVVAGSAAQAEIVATALFVGGLMEETIACLRGAFARAVVVTETGEIHELCGALA